MDVIVTDEEQVINNDQPFPGGLSMIYFKLVGIGDNTLTKANGMGKGIVEEANAQSGFMVIGKNNTLVRKAMHDLVDRFCDLQEGKDESES